MSDTRSSVGADESVPRIAVWCVGDRSPLVAPIERGIEEERVSWTVRAGYEGDVVDVAHRAANESKLKIGVGVGERGAVLHHQQLPRSTPVFSIRDVSTDQARKIGSNAARLAKRLPFKSLE